MAIKQMRVAELVEDMDVYPRHAVDDAHIASLVRALESGATFPPVIAEQRTKRIVDGWHRCRATTRHGGPEAAIDVDLRRYNSEGSLLLEAVTLNAKHGRKLDAIDQSRCVVMLERANVEEAHIAMALHCPPEHVIKLRVRLATATHEGSGTIPGGKEVALKRPVTWMAGQKLTDDQMETHAMLPGTSFLLITRQLSKALSSKMVNLDDVKLVDALRQLKDVLIEVLV
jgi:hypothetical protein